MEQTILDELKALRQDIETQTAINIIEGINTIETMALLAHWMRHKRAPNAKQAAQIEKAARERWAEQVRHAVALAREDAGALDASLPRLVSAIEEGAGKAKKKAKRRS